LLIVLFSGLMPGERLTALHIAGALLSFAGSALLILGTGGGLGAGGSMTGYVFAALAALTWALYSILSRRLGAVPTASVAVFCLVTAVLSAICHVILEPTLWPLGAIGWLSVLALGLGPVGLAFYVWDIGVKHGDIQLLGVASYAAPLLSTTALILAQIADATARIAGAAVLITAGAALAAYASARVRRDEVRRASAA
jgi:drug/metabolite transporter (DMT)-like permease